MKKILFILFLFVHLLGFGQNNLSVKLVNDRIPFFARGNNTPALLMDNFEDFKRIPPGFSKDSIWLYKVVLDREQYWYYKIVNNHPNVSYYQNQIKSYAIDTTSLIKKNTKSFVGIFVGVKNREKTIIVDSNNNRDFGDEFETKYFFTSNEIIKFHEDYRNVGTFLIDYEDVRGNKIINKNQFLQVTPFQLAYSFKEKLDSLRTIHFKINSCLIGEFEIDYITYSVYLVKNNSLGLDNKIKDFNISIIGKNSIPKSYDWVKYNTSFKVDSIIFNVQSLNPEGDSLRLNYRKSTFSDFGWDVGDYVQQDFLKKYVNFKTTTTKLTFLSFWGSWCGPCIEEIPDLIQFYNSNSETITLINLASEKNQDGVEKAKTIIENKRIPGKHDFSELNASNAIATKLNVQNFPCFIVVDNSGKILAREVGLGSIEKLKVRFNLN